MSRFDSFLGKTRGMDEIHEHFSTSHFIPPATSDQVVAVETQLGVRLPDVLRRMYLRYDGFRESLGNAQYLLPLAETSECSNSLIRINTLFWNEWDLLDLTLFLFFGLSTGDCCWG